MIKSKILLSRRIGDKSMKTSVVYAKKNKCYQSAQKLTGGKPMVLMVHSTATKGVMANRFADAFNKYQPNGSSVCCHGFLDDSEYIQILPYDINGWHCGGSANWNSIGIEWCESSNYSDKTYFNKILANGIELYAGLCKKYGISPDNIISHAEGYKKGVASNHADPMHWWKNVGYDMDKFRSAVKAKINGTTSSKPEEATTTKPTTKQAYIKSLQMSLNAAYKLKLEIDGSAGPLTQSAIKSHYLWYNSRSVLKSVHVSWLQGALKRVGYTITVDGSFGPATKAVVMQFQRDRKLAVDGYAGLATHLELIEAIC